MLKERLFIPVLLGLLGIVGMVLAIRPVPSPAGPDAVQPPTSITKAADALPLGPALPAAGGAATTSAAQAERQRWLRLAAGLSGPLSPDGPTVLLVDHPVTPSVVPSVLHLPPAPSTPDTRPEFENEIAPKAAGASHGPVPAAPALVLGSMPSPTLSFDAMTFNLNGAGHPPDTNGDVGTDHFMEAVNTSIGIYTKTTGAEAVTFAFNDFWFGAGSGTACDTSNQGDPIVLYDSLHQHWIFMDFAWTNIKDGPYFFCFGVSQTDDPLGAYWAYAIRADDNSHPFLADYPKGGIWPDGLYFSANMFDCLNSSCSIAPFQEARAYAFNLLKMESGLTLTANDTQAKDTSASVFTLMPSNVRGALPPNGTPNYFVSEDAFDSFWDVFKFHVDFTAPLSSTFGGPTQVSQASYTTAKSSVPEPPPGNASDTLADRMMFLNQYRNISGTESLWVQHTTGTASASTPTGIQWAQLNVTGGTVSTAPVQEQIYNNGADGLNRFMGSLAVDQNGSAALGFSVSSNSVAPDLRIVGRLATDPLNQMPRAERTLLAGAPRSVQTGNCGGSPCTRWGDYSAMTVDPVDDCTFWYANMYFPAQGPNWVTRIAAFKFPGCPVPLSTTTSLAASANPAVFGQPVTLTATVAISGPGVDIPTGVVTFTVDGSAMLTATLSGGAAAVTTSSLSIGSHPITVTYGGDAGFLSSAGTLTPDLLVNQANTSLSVVSSQNPVALGQVVTFTASVAPVAPGAGTPTGVITFTVDASTVSTATLSSGSASIAASSLLTGTHPVAVTYSGDANFASSAAVLIPDQVVIDAFLIDLPLILR